MSHEAPSLTENEKEALAILKDRKKTVDAISTATASDYEVRPGDYDLRAAPFKGLVRKGLAKECEHYFGKRKLLAFRLIESFTA